MHFNQYSMTLASVEFLVVPYSSYLFIYSYLNNLGFFFVNLTERQRNKKLAKKYAMSFDQCLMSMLPIQRVLKS